MQLVNLTIYKKNNALVNQSVIFDVDDIVVPIRSNILGKSYFTAKAKSSIVTPNSVIKVAYEANETLSVIQALSTKLLILTVISRQSVSMNNEIMIFNVSLLSEVFITIGDRTQFSYCEDGNPETVTYIVAESISEIMAQQTSGIPPDVLAEIEILKNNEYKISYFEPVSSASGQITIPTNATVITGEFFGGIDAYVSEINNGQPNGQFPEDSSGTTVDVASFDALGNYILTSTPTNFPVAIIFILKIKAIDYSNLNFDNILDLEGINDVPFQGADKDVNLNTQKLFAGQTNIGNASSTNQRMLRIGQGLSFVDIGAYTQGSGVFGVIYFNQPNPGPSNYAFLGNAATTQFNATSTVAFNISDVTQIALTNNLVMLQPGVWLQLGNAFTAGAPTNTTAGYVTVKDSGGNSVQLVCWK